MPRQRIDLDPVDALSVLDEEGRVDAALEPAIPRTISVGSTGRSSSPAASTSACW